MRKQNNLGHFTKDMSILITKDLQEIADKALIRVRPILRDELERIHRANIYDSYMPAENGKYHHTGTLASSVKGIIDGNTVKAVIESKEFPDSKYRSGNGATLTTEVYEILKHGSTAHPRKDSFRYKAKKNSGKDVGWSEYIQQKPHNFEQKTLNDIDEYISQDLIPALTKKSGYLYEQLIQKYKNKRL